MTTRIDINPTLIEWALERSGRTVEELKTRFPKIQEWERAEVCPTMRQLEDLAKITRTPLGYFFLSSPPEEKLPIPDLRTVGDEAVEAPSPDLLETVEHMQRRQEWMREYVIEEGQAPFSFVASASLNDDPAEVAKSIMDVLGLSEGWAESESTWTDALRALREAIEDAGVLVTINGVVGNNTHRKLDVDEFRGFTLVDEYAPLIFINGSDAKAAQMFTLVHELAHLWLGKEGVSNLYATQPADIAVERFSNTTAAEFLIPSNKMAARWGEATTKDDPFQYLARRFKVSALVAARRAFDLNYIDKDQFFSFYEAYKEETHRRQQRQRGGGDFWKTAHVRIGDNFGTAVVQAAKEGRLLYREAYELTGLYGKTFDKFAAQLGF